MSAFDSSPHSTCPLPLCLASRQKPCLDQLPRLQPRERRNTEPQRRADRRDIIIVRSLRDSIESFRVRSALLHSRRARKEVLVEELILLCANCVSQRIAEHRINRFRAARWRWLRRAGRRHVGGWASVGQYQQQPWFEGRLLLCSLQSGEASIMRSGIFDEVGDVPRLTFPASTSHVDEQSFVGKYIEHVLCLQDAQFFEFTGNRLEGSSLLFQCSSCTTVDANTC